MGATGAAGCDGAGFLDSRAHPASSKSELCVARILSDPQFGPRAPAVPARHHLPSWPPAGTQGTRPDAAMSNSSFTPLLATRALQAILALGPPNGSHAPTHRRRARAHQRRARPADPSSYSETRTRFPQLQTVRAAPFLSWAPCDAASTTRLLPRRFLPPLARCEYRPRRRAAR